MCSMSYLQAGKMAGLRVTQMPRSHKSFWLCFRVIWTSWSRLGYGFCRTSLVFCRAMNLIQIP